MEYSIGTTVTFTAIFTDRETKQRGDPDTGTLSLKFFQDEVEIHTGNPTKVEVGKWSYNWDTSETVELKKGKVKVQWLAKFSGDQAKKEYFVTFVEVKE